MSTAPRLRNLPYPNNCVKWQHWHAYNIKQGKGLSSNRKRLWVTVSNIRMVYTDGLRQPPWQKGTYLWLCFLMVLWTKCLCPYPTPPPNSYFEALTPQCNGIWRWGLCEVIRWGQETAPTCPSSPLPLPYTHTKKRSCEHRARWQLPTSQGFRRKPTLPAGDLRLLSLQKCEKIDFCCLSHPIYGTLLWQPKLTNRHRRPTTEFEL